MLIWHGVHEKATRDIQAPYLCHGSSFPPEFIWLLVPSGLPSLQEKTDYVCMSLENMLFWTLCLREGLKGFCYMARPLLGDWENSGLHELFLSGED